MPNLKKENKNLLFIGFPNVGKSTLFNSITNEYVEVGNNTGTTVKIHQGKLKNSDYNVFDLPGTYSIEAKNKNEQVLFDYYYSKENSKLVNVVGAKSLKRDLLKTVSLLESGNLCLVVLNMFDELKTKVDIKKLSEELNVEVIPTVAVKKHGINNIYNYFSGNVRSSGFVFDYKKLEHLISTLALEINDDKINNRFLASQFILKNNSIIQYLKSKNVYEKVLNVYTQWKKSHKKFDEINYINHLKQKYILNLLVKINYMPNYSKSKFQNTVDAVLLNKYSGIPIFFGVLLFIYFVSYKLVGLTLKNYSDDFFQFLSNEVHKGFAHTNLHDNGFISGILADGIINGVGTLIGFLPLIVILFFLISLLNTSGYLARVSAIFDDVLYKVGLSGKSVIMLITGIGCNVPSILATRTINNRKERIINIMIAPFMSCSARAPIYLLFSTIYFTNYSWLVAFSFTMLGALVALLVGFIFSNTLFRKHQTPFLALEIPNWRFPQMKNILKFCWFNIKGFLIKAGTYILLGVTVVYILLHIGPTGLLNDSQVDGSFLAYIGKGLRFFLIPIGLGSDWRIITTLLAAFPAKEASISALSVIFQLDKHSLAAFFTIPQALSYMTFALLYMPCLSTIVVTKKELNWKWAFASIGISLLAALTLASIVYWVSFGIVKA